MWMQLGMLLIASLVMALLAPKPQAPKPQTLDDAQVPSAEEGKDISVVFGTVWKKSPNVSWYGDLRTTPIKTKGGKK